MLQVRMKVGFIVMATLACIIGLYPITYLIIDRTFGLLKSKSALLLGNVFWNVGFYTHIIFGGLALLVGWVQFNSRLRQRKMSVHRIIGKVYLIAALLSSVASIYIAFYATGGIVATLGFLSLGCIWFYSTIRSYIYIKNGCVDLHQYMATYSYAACFSAVTLRIFLPLLIFIFHDFIKAYTIVAWLFWVPNIIVAYFLVVKLHREKYALGIEVLHNNPMVKKNFL